MWKYSGELLRLEKGMQSDRSVRSSRNLTVYVYTYQLMVLNSSGSTQHMLLLGAPQMPIPVCHLSALSEPTPSAAWQDPAQAFTGFAKFIPAVQLLRSEKRSRHIFQSLQLIVHRADIGVSASSTGGTSGTPQSPWWYASLQPPEPCALPPLPLLFRLSECDIAVILISGRSADALRRFFST